MSDSSSHDMSSSDGEVGERKRERSSTPILVPKKEHRSERERDQTRHSPVGARTHTPEGGDRPNKKDPVKSEDPSAGDRNNSDKHIFADWSEEKSERKARKKAERSEQKAAQRADKQAGSVLRKENKERLRQKPNASSSNPSSNELADDPAVNEDLVLFAGWCKMHTSTMKVGIWLSKWCCLRPGRLVHFSKEQKLKHGRTTAASIKDSAGTTIRLLDCEVAQRSTSKDGYAFDIVHVGGSRQTILTLRVFSEVERDNWIFKLNEQIYAANKLRWLGEGVSESGNMGGDGYPTAHLPTEIREKFLQEQQSYRSGELATVLMPVPPSAGELAPSAVYYGGQKQNGDAHKADPGDLLKSNADLRHAIGNTIVATSRTASMATAESALHEMDGWHKSLDMRLMGVERKIISAVKARAGVTSSDARISLAWWKLALFCVVCVLLGRAARTYFQRMY